MELEVEISDVERFGELAKQQVSSAATLEEEVVDNEASKDLKVDCSPASSFLYVMIAGADFEPRSHVEKRALLATFWGCFLDFGMVVAC